MTNTRRDLLVTIAASSAALAAEKPHAHSHEADQAPATPAAPYTPKIFSPAELATIGALTEVILPRTETPGALDAKCHELIDEMLATRPAQQQIWKKGLAEVDALAKRLHQAAYTSLNPEQQVAVMVELSNKSDFFKALKDATIDTYYSTKQGLMTELGWNANLPLPEFKGCTHPEHQS